MKSGLFLYSYFFSYDDVQPHDKDTLEYISSDKIAVVIRLMAYASFKNVSTCFTLLDVDAFVIEKSK